MILDPLPPLYVTLGTLHPPPPWDVTIFKLQKHWFFKTSSGEILCKNVQKITFDFLVDPLPPRMCHLVTLHCRNLPPSFPKVISII